MCSNAAAGRRITAAVASDAAFRGRNKSRRAPRESTDEGGKGKGIEGVWGGGGFGTPKQTLEGKLKLAGRPSARLRMLRAAHVAARSAERAVFSSGVFVQSPTAKTVCWPSTCMAARELLGVDSRRT